VELGAVAEDQVFNPLGSKCAAAATKAMDLISLGNQKFSQI